VQSSNYDLRGGEWEERNILGGKSIGENGKNQFKGKGRSLSKRERGITHL